MGAAAGLTVIRLLIAAAWRDQALLCDNERGRPLSGVKFPQLLSAPVVELVASRYSHSSQAPLLGS